jgi:hypothetical protein
LIESIFGLDSASSDIVLCLVATTNEDGGPVGVGIPLKPWRNTYVRSSPYLTLSLDELPTGPTRRICVRRDLGARDSCFITRTLSPTTDILEGVAGKKRDVDEAHLQDELASSIPNINPTDFIKPGPYTFAQNESGGFSVSLKTGESSVLLGRMIPIRPHDNSRSGGREVLQQTTTRVGLKHRQTERGRSAKRMVTEATESSMDSDSNSEDLSLCSDSTELGHPILHDQHPLAQFTDELVEIGLERFSQWPLPSENTRTTAEHGMLTSFMQSKRQKREDDTCVKIECVSDSEDEDAVHVRMRSRQSTTEPETRHFACPIHLQNPTRRQNCLKYGGFPTIPHLSRHILTDHYKPYDCPICFETFDLLGACDDHIRKDECRTKPRQQRDRLSNNQRRRLSRRPDPSLSKEEQWYSIWNIIFPGVERPSTPYLSASMESRVLALRAFWSKNGLGIVSEFVAQHRLQGDAVQLINMEGDMENVLDDDMDDDILALKDRVLSFMVDEIVKLDR